MLRTKLFGVPEFSIHTQSLAQTLTGRRLALLAYLLCHEQPAPRSVLCDLLWTDLPEEQARENLRSLLSHTRRVIGGYLIADRQAVAFNRAAPYWADIEAFSTFLADGQARTDPALLRETLHLYRGEFLAGFYIQGAPVFEGWLLAQRQQWQTQAVQGWQQLAQYHFTQGDDAAGLVANAHLLALEPWHEDAHRRQMIMLARSGQRDAALAYFDRCCAILREEVDAPPDAETIAVYEQIKSGVWSPNGAHTHRPAAPITVAPPPPSSHNAQAVSTQYPATNGQSGAGQGMNPPAPLAVDWGSMPHEPRFHGRQAELRQLHQWCVHDRRRVVAVLGVGGQGKSALAVRFIRTLTEGPQVGNGAGDKAPPFERVIWRSLLAAPPVTDIVQDWLQQLSDQQVVTRPPTLDQQFTLLHNYLQRRRFLLVLDNVESILLDDGSGTCRPGHEAYEQVWQLFVQRDQQCCLLLTSRERPRLFSSHEEQAGALRTLLLDGLALADGQQLLRTHRVVGDEATMRTLLGCYSGNPLALKLVADTIMERSAVAIPAAITAIHNQCNEAGHALVFVAVDGQLAGALELHTTLRPQVKELIHALHQRGLATYIISGDQEAPTRKIEHYFAQTLPENKAALIQKLQATGKMVCFIGDGINDAIALKQAHVSISIRGASTVATDTAQIILMEQSLQQLLPLFTIANALDRNMRRNLFLGMLPGIVCIGGAFFLHFGFLSAVILHQVGIITCVTNAMLPMLRYQRKKVNHA